MGVVRPDTVFERVHIPIGPGIRRRGTPVARHNWYYPAGANRSCKVFLTGIGHSPYLRCTLDMRSCYQSLSVSGARPSGGPPFPIS